MAHGSKRDRDLAAAHDFERELGQQLRVDSVRCSSAAGSGHPTSSMSAADLMAVLLDKYLRVDPADPKHPGNDHLIFSKGHASPLLYSMLKAAGLISDEELMTFRQSGSRLEGHPTPQVPLVDVATGSLGQGLPVGVGLAIAGRDLDRLPYRVWVLCGDSELAEGSIWEAVQHAGWAALDNLTLIVDVNRLGQTRETMLGWDLDGYAARLRAFGWHAVTLDGHDVAAIDAALAEATSTTGRPTALVARTRKGRGFSVVEDHLGAHGKPVSDPQAAITELGGERRLRVELRTPPPVSAPASAPASTPASTPTSTPASARARQPGNGADKLPHWQLGEKVPTRDAYGAALAALGAARPELVALDGEVSDSTRSIEFQQAYPDRYFEMFIAEQQLVGAAVGLQARGWVVFGSTFAAFLTRAYDFIRMASVSRADLRLVGSHAGVSIGQDGPSQMGLEDLAMIRAVHGSVVLHPSDANQTAQLVAAMADQPGISYLRTLRGGTEVRTPPDEPVRIGGSRVVRRSDRDEFAVIGCGVTVQEADQAAQQLAAEGVPVRVLDCYSIKPLDARAVRAAAEGVRAVITVEDHHPEGGLGEAVLSALGDLPGCPPVRKLAVRMMPGSGTPAEQLARAGIDSTAIAATVHQLRGQGEYPDGDSPEDGSPEDGLGPDGAHAPEGDSPAGGPA